MRYIRKTLREVKSRMENLHCRASGLRRDNQMECLYMLSVVDFYCPM